MTSVQRSPSAPAAPATPSRLRLWMKRLAVALVLLAVIAWGLFSWLFYNPFEGSVERLDRVIPSTAVVAIRGSAEELLKSPFVARRILGREDVSEQLAILGVDEALQRLDREQALLNEQLPGFLRGFDVRRDILGRETVVFAKPGPAPPATDRPGGGESGTASSPLEGLKVAAATRISRRARMILSILKHDWMRRKIEDQSPLKITRYSLLYEIDLSKSNPAPGWATAYAALVRDVLIVGNDRDLVGESARLAMTGGMGSLPDRPDAGRTFSGESDAPLRAFADLNALAASMGDRTPGVLLQAEDGITGVAGFLLDLDSLATAQGVLRFPGPDTAVLDASGVRGSAGLSLLPGDLADGRTRPAHDALEEAAILAPAGSAVAAARLESTTGNLFRLLYGRAGPEIRKAVETAMGDAKTSIDDVARELDDYLERGVSVVVERLPECDALALDQFGAGPSGRFVLPLPGVLLVFRQRESAGQGGAERMFRRRFEEWKAHMDKVEDLAGLPEGMRGLRFRPKFLTGEKALVEPAVAFEKDLVLLSSNEGTLRRALEARAGKRPALSDFPGFEAACAGAGEGECALFVEMGGLTVMLRDQRREVATARIEVDPFAERKRIIRDVALHSFQGQQVVAQKDIEAEVDRRCEEAQSNRENVEFPKVMKEYLDGLETLKEVRSLTGTLSWDQAGLRLRLLLQAAEGAK